ncbi:hypothetical protein M378DRAFT_199549, partial [Amanita muscaria Koide BX008]
MYFDTDVASSFDEPKTTSRSVTSRVERFHDMSSSSSDPLSEIPQELKDLFSWNPPPLNPLPFLGTKMSTKTHPPAFFDRHFRPELKLLRVKRLPSLVRDITAIVDETIMNSFNDGFQFPPSGKLPSAEQLEFSVFNIDWDMADEKAVASFYDKTTATFCAPVASTLALRLSDWNTLLVWTQLANVSGYAIADGFLKVASPTNLAKKETQLKEAMGEETLRLLQVLSTRRASLVTNEFKNLAAGGPEVMLAIPNLSNSPSFDWTGCEFPNCALMTHHVNEVFLGPDAKNTPWTVDSHSNNSMSPLDPGTVPPTLPQPRENGEIAPASVSALLPASVPPPSLSTGSSSVQGFSEDVGTSKAVKRKRDESRANSPLVPEASSVPEIPLVTTFQGHEPRNSSRIAAKKQKLNDPINVIQSTSLMLPPPLPVGGVRVETAFQRGKGKGKGKVVGGGDDEDGDDERDDEAVDDPSHKDRHELSAQLIVQQAWAQATRVDGSIIVLQSGNHEFIGIRHRTTQTLYISDLIKPHACKEPSYGRLHVGIYIAGIRDALDRERQRDARPPGGGNGPSGSGGDKQDGPSDGGPGSGHRGDRGGGRKGDHKDESGGSKKSKEGKYRGGNVHKKMAIAAHKMAAKSTLELASGRNVILLYLQYDIYDSSAPSTFVRSGPTGHPTPLPSQETVRNYQLEECLTIVLKSEISHGATGQVLHGTLEVEASECALLDVAVKLALGSERCEALRDEYKFYHQLKSKGVTT